MSAFQAAYEVLRHVVGDVEADRLLVAVENEKLHEAIASARSEYLHDDTGTSEDEAYNQGVSDAVAAIGALLNTVSSGSTAGDTTWKPWGGHDRYCAYVGGIGKCSCSDAADVRELVEGGEL